jgi:hypothetical protein
LLQQPSRPNGAILDAGGHVGGFLSPLATKELIQIVDDAH